MATIAVEPTAGAAVLSIALGAGGPEMVLSSGAETAGAIFSAAGAGFALVGVGAAAFGGAVAGAVAMVAAAMGGICTGIGASVGALLGAWAVAAAASIAKMVTAMTEREADIVVVEVWWSVRRAEVTAGVVGVVEQVWVWISLAAFSAGFEGGRGMQYKAGGNGWKLIFRV
jgi:hypothetical protein